MSAHYPAKSEGEGGKLSLSLAERMDSSIGEATSVMGAMITELIRRSLRGGITQIGEQLNGFVAEKVDATIADRTPAIEQGAAEVAKDTARATAAEVAGTEVQALEQRTKDGDRELAARIEETAHKAQETTSEAARHLAGQIELAEKKAEVATATTARELARQIEEAEKRVGETTQAAVAQRLEEVLQHSRRGTSLLKARLSAVEAAAGKLEKLLVEEQSRRSAEQAALVQQLKQAEGQLRHALKALAVRVAELEKPRGLRALLNWMMFWRKKKAQPASEDSLPA